MLLLINLVDGPAIKLMEALIGKVKIAQPLISEKDWVGYDPSIPTTHYFNQS